MSTNDKPASKMVSEVDYRTIAPLYDADGNEQNFVLVQEIKVVRFEDGSALIEKGKSSLYELAKPADEPAAPASVDAIQDSHRTDIDQMAENAFMARCLCGWKGAEHTYRGRAAREADDHLLQVATAPD